MTIKTPDWVCRYTEGQRDHSWDKDNRYFASEKMCVEVK